jgi:hypothetical protein
MVIADNHWRLIVLHEARKATPCPEAPKDCRTDTGEAKTAGRSAAHLDLHDSVTITHGQFGDREAETTAGGQEQERTVTPFLNRGGVSEVDEGM